jgi:hypothetical protein
MTISLRPFLMLLANLRLGLASLLGYEAMSFGETCCCQLEDFSSPPPPLSERLRASCTVWIHYISCQWDENRTHIPLFNIHTMNEWRQLSLWSLDEGRELRNARRQIRLCSYSEEVWHSYEDFVSRLILWF